MHDDRRRSALTLLSSCLLTITAAGCFGAARNAHIAAPVDVEMDAHVLAKFQHEIEEYVQLHQELVRRVPTVGPQSTPEEIAAHQNKMRVAIQAERKNAHQGEIFKPSVTAAFRHIIEKEIAGPDGKAILDAARQGNPTVEGVPTPSAPNAAVKARVTVAVNAAYPDDAPMSSVPSHLLLTLPQLPEEVKYRFVGRDLILRETEANVILDYIKDVLPPSAAR
jgi:hypothetical protein